MLFKLSDKQKTLTNKLLNKVYNCNDKILKNKLYNRLIKYKKLTLKYKEIDKFIYKISNKKLGSDTIILNLSSALNCSQSNKCQFYKTNKCYALHSERQYSYSLLYHNAEFIQWKTKDVNYYIDNLIKIIKKNKKIKFIRFNESGDITCQDDIIKLNKIADVMKAYKIKVYTYTHNNKLNYSNLSDNLIINSSLITNKIDNYFINFKPKNKKVYNCQMNCKTCQLCKTKDNKIIYCKIH